MPNQTWLLSIRQMEGKGLWFLQASAYQVVFSGKFLTCLSHLLPTRVKGLDRFSDFKWGGKLSELFEEGKIIF